MKWEDGTPRSTLNDFTWNTGEPTVFAKDPYFQPKGKDGASTSQLASLAREQAENRGLEVATIEGIGRIVIDRYNLKSFHVHAPKGKK